MFNEVSLNIKALYE